MHNIKLIAEIDGKQYVIDTAANHIAVEFLGDSLVIGHGDYEVYCDLIDRETGKILSARHDN